MKSKFCPKCESSEVMMEAAGITGTWKCKVCDFRGPIFPEKEPINEREDIAK
jgi:ribosomal protein L37AE/L43A